MYKTYYSNAPNEVQQLLVTVSKHLHIGVKGQLLYQKKPFEISLNSLEKSIKNHLLLYFLRDHYSGVFYVEMCSSNKTITTNDFLLRDWFQKTNIEFCGIPKALMVTNIVDKNFDVDPLLNEFGIIKTPAPSGFASGMRIVRDWEDDVRFRIDPEYSPDLHLFSSWNPKTTAFFSYILQKKHYNKFTYLQERLVPDAGYQNFLIKKYCSEGFRRVEEYPLKEGTKEMMELLMIE